MPSESENAFDSINVFYSYCIYEIICESTD